MGKKAAAISKNEKRPTLFNSRIQCLCQGNVSFYRITFHCRKFPRSGWFTLECSPQTRLHPAWPPTSRKRALGPPSRGSVGRWRRLTLAHISQDKKSPLLVCNVDVSASIH